MNHDRIMATPFGFGKVVEMNRHDRIMSYALAHQATIPRQGSQCYILLQAMFDGERFTVASALSELGIYALSQRRGELERMGWPIKSDWVTVGSGKRVKRYWLEA